MKLSELKEAHYDGECSGWAESEAGEEWDVACPWCLWERVRDDVAREAEIFKKKLLKIVEIDE